MAGRAETTAELHARRANGLKMKYLMDTARGRLEWQRAAVGLTRRLIDPNMAEGTYYLRAKNVQILNATLVELAIPHALPVQRKDGPRLASERHPDLYAAFRDTEERFSTSDKTERGRVLGNFVRKVNVLTPDASDADRVTIVVDALQALAIEASAPNIARRTDPRLIQISGREALLPLTLNQADVLPPGWATAYEKPLDFSGAVMLSESTVDMPTRYR